ncbi:MAG: hypothetical protein IJ493_06400 [Clostridia bacterium]|nr:hypothetical protein [Clostridia bacterium]
MFRVILTAILYAVIVFAAQSMLFGKTARTILQLIPLFFVGMVYIACACLIVYDLNTGSGYLFITEMTLCAILINTAGLAAVGVAWLIEKV